MDFQGTASQPKGMEHPFSVPLTLAHQIWYLLTGILASSAYSNMFGMEYPSNGSVLPTDLWLISMSVWSNSQPWPSVDVEFSTGDNLRLPEDAQMLKPHFFPAIPRLLNRVHQSAMAAGNVPGLKGALFWEAVRQKLDQYHATGVSTYPFWDALVFRKVRAVLGGNLLLVSKGSPPISAEVIYILKIALFCEIMEDTKKRLPRLGIMSGKVILVTGRSKGGIGFYLCERFSEQGCTVYATSRTLETMDGFKHPVEKRVMDVTSDDDVKLVVQSILEEQGKIDIVVNNAGPLLDVSLDQARKAFETNTGSGSSSLETRRKQPHSLYENGPCLVNADRNSTTLNPYSWNNLSNMIYIDQPIGTGFSYGTDTVNSTKAAAPFVWTAFQVLFESQLFSKYASREFIFATESYGGHYGPSFVTYFEEQNTLIASGEIDAVPIVVSALMINKQYIAYLNFATYAPGYGQLQPDDVLKNISDSLYGPDGCVAQENACYAAGTSTNSNKICRDADNYCDDNVFTPAAGNYDGYDIRQNSSGLFPPEYYVHYLHKEDVMKKIDAQVKYEECSDVPYENESVIGAKLLSPLEALILVRACAQSITERAHPRPADFYFASSISTVATWQDPIPEAITDDPSVAQGLGYAQSKWITEKLCQVASQQTPIGAGVLRLIGQIVGDSQNGVWNETEVISLIIKCTDTIGILPDVDESVSWLSVDYAAKASSIWSKFPLNAYPWESALFRT
ncbi:Alpha/Beta hydrolase protein [Suillus tomentosus]|nr:Alpha/Beta hydrolase protein [Suillus tomentosus]